MTAGEKITVYGVFDTPTPAPANLPIAKPDDLSNHVLKLTAYLRYRNFDYEIIPIPKHRNKKAPRGLAPWVDFRGKTYHDGTRIIQQLEELVFPNPNERVDSELTPVQLARSTALRYAVERCLLYYMPRHRFAKGHEKVFREQMALNRYIPKLFVGLAIRSFRKNIKKVLQTTQVGRLDEKEADQEFNELLDSIEQELQENDGKQFLFTDEVPSVIDFVLYGLLGEFIWDAYTYPAGPQNRFKRLLLPRTRIISYVQRLDKAFVGTK